MDQQVIESLVTLGRQYVSVIRRTGRLLPSEGHRCSKHCQFDELPLVRLNEGHICSPLFNNCGHPELHNGTYAGRLDRKEMALLLCHTTGSIHLCGGAFCKQVANTPDGDCVCTWTGAVLHQSASSFAPKYNKRELQGYVSRYLDEDTVESRSEAAYTGRAARKKSLKHGLHGSKAFNILVKEICAEILSEERFRRDLETEKQTTLALHQKIDRYLAQCNSRRRKPSFTYMVQMCTEVRQKNGFCTVLVLPDATRRFLVNEYAKHIQIAWGILATTCKDVGGSELTRPDIVSIRVFVLAMFEVMTHGVTAAGLHGETVTLVDHDPILHACPLTKEAHKMVLRNQTRNVFSYKKKIVRAFIQAVAKLRVNPQHLRLAMRDVDEFGEEPFAEIRC